MLGREGDERLGGSKRTKAKDASVEPEQSQTVKAKEKTVRTGSVRRALKTVYDDMLREEVPQDFLDLLGKLD